MDLSGVRREVAAAVAVAVLHSRNETIIIAYRCSLAALRSHINKRCRLEVIIFINFASQLAFRAPYFMAWVGRQFYYLNDLIWLRSLNRFTFVSYVLSTVYILCVSLLMRNPGSYIL